MSRVKEISTEILKYLLAEFVDRALTSKELTNGYVGLSLATIKQKCCGTAAASVDFDLALKDLEEADLIDTGPKVPYDNPPGSTVVILAMFSKYEHAYLTEKGYRAAQEQVAKRVTAAPIPRVHISGSTFHQSQIGIGAEVHQSTSMTHSHPQVLMDLHKVIDENVIEAGERVKLRAAIEGMEKAHGTPSFVDRYKVFIALAADHMTLVAPLLAPLTTLLSGK